MQFHNMDTPAWVSDSVFYQIFPDRFARSALVSKSNLNLEDWDSPPTAYGFKGGDLYGIIEHLDYLEDLGVNALYLTPVFASASNHRYHTYDYYAVDPLLGGNQALRDLLDASHARGIRVVLDGVFNHASRGFWQFHQTLENGAESPYVDWFHFDSDRLNRLRHWGAYPTPEELRSIRDQGSLPAIGYQGWWDLPALPKFNTDNLAVREFLLGVAQHWIEFGIDGWRLDVPGEIRDDSFWQEFRQRVRSVNSEAYIVGEVWHDARHWLQGDQFDACTNYQFTAACLSFFPGKYLDLEKTLRVGGFRNQVRRKDARAFGKRIEWLLEAYAPEVTRVQLNPLDSHDTPRFLTCAGGDVASLEMALMMLFTFPGAPCLFYGDELGLQGEHDPDCRRSFPKSGSAGNQQLRNYTKGLIQLRHDRADWRWGAFRQIKAEGMVYAFERDLDAQRSAVVLNAGEAPAEIVIGEAPSSLHGSQLLFGKAEVLHNQPLTVRVPPRAGAVLELGGHQAGRNR